MNGAGDDEIVHVAIDGVLDLHAFRPADVEDLLDEYVRGAHEAGIEEIRIIHGRGRGVLRGRVQAVLERHPLVESFWDATETHLGATVARLNRR